MRLLRPTTMIPLLAIATACTVKTAPPTTWTVTPHAAQPARLDPAGPALGVARFTASTQLRTTDVSWRTEEGRHIHESDDRWADYPDRMLEEMTRATLLRSGRFSAVVPAPPTAALDVVLDARLLDFTDWHEGDTIEARVGVEWRLRRPTGELIAQDLVHASRAVEQRTVAGVVRTYQAASQDAVDALVAAVIAKLPPAAPD